MPTPRIFSLLAVVLALVASGCTPSGRDATPATLVFGFENDLTTLDPIKIQEPYALQVIGQIYEGLVALDGQNALVPALAERWSHNDDFTVWRFEIRRGVRFHPDPAFGPDSTREITAEDVRYSFERVVSPASYPAFVLADAVQGVPAFQDSTAQNVSGFRVIGPYTFEITLLNPEPTFLHRITSSWFGVYPREVAELGADAFGRTRAIGTGPFRLVSRTDTEVRLERNPDYWRETSGNVEDLRFTVVKNDQIRLSELRNGRLSLMRLPVTLAPTVLRSGTAIPEPGAEPALVTGGFEVSAFPTFNTHFIGFNCDRLDPALRRAISLAINREEVVRAITNGTGVVVTGTVPAGLQGYTPPYSGDIFNLDSARAVLQQAGPGPHRIELIVHDRDNTEQLGQLLQAQLRPLGIEVTLIKLDYNAAVGRMIEGNTEAFALSLEYVFSAPEPILRNIFHSEKIPVPNFWHYRNPTVDAGLDSLRTVPDRARANALARRVEKTMIDDAPAAFLYQSRNLVMYPEGMGGVAFNGHGIPLLWEVTVGDE